VQRWTVAKHRSWFFQAVCCISATVLVRI